MANTALARIDETTGKIEEIVKTCNITSLAAMSSLTQAVTLATGIQQLRSLLTDDVMNAVFMPLQSSALGFLTDKDAPPKDITPDERRVWVPGYKVNVVRDVVVEMLIHGLRPVGNEINIISRRMYAAKNGLARLVGEFPGLTDLVVVPSAPCLNDKGSDARIAVNASWRLNGSPMSLSRDVTKRQDGTIQDERFSIRVNYGMGADAIAGKAMRKAYAAILSTLTGSKLTIQDGDITDTIGEIVESKPIALPDQDGKRMHLGSKREPSPMREPGQEG